MSNKSLDEDLKALVIGYQSARSAYIAEQYLDALVAKSTPENFEAIIEQMHLHPKVTELDYSMYICDIASPDFKGLLPIIAEFRKSFKDKDAIEDLDDAEVKIAGGTPPVR